DYYCQVYDSSVLF
nr:immunoglobulin light chain junction region [Macaca mulatta]